MAVIIDRGISVDYKEAVDAVKKHEAEATAVKKLEEWFGNSARQLPWRASHDPYKIWVSEVMLQQTQVATVIPYYERFLENFPTLKSLAMAPEERILALWSGLGYYSRARNLQKGAQYLCDQFRGIFPKDPLVLRTIPGIGPYTAGAISSIAWDLPSPLVDGNVERVFSRYFGWKKPLPDLKKEMWSKADEWVKAAKSPRMLNQALMELGALICVKAKPSCVRCPIRSGCIAYKKDLTDVLPFKKTRPRVKELFWLGLIHEKSGKYFLKQNRKGEWWQDLWDFPRLEFESRKEMEKKMRELAGIPLQTTKHTVTHHRIHLHPVRVSKVPTKKGRWVTEKALPTLPISSLTRKVYELCIATESGKDKQHKLPI
jgi:A/G-specific adenine glycosylase